MRASSGTAGMCWWLGEYDFWPATVTRDSVHRPYEQHLLPNSGPGQSLSPPEGAVRIRGL